MKKILSMVLILSLFLVIGCGKKQNAVAYVGNEVITVQQLKDKLSTKFRTKDFRSMPMDTKTKAVNELIEEKIKQLHAKEIGLTSSPVTLVKAKLARDRHIYGLLLEKETEEYANSEKNILDYYEAIKQKAHIRHILIGYKGAEFSRSKRTEEEAATYADSIKKEINSGRLTFEDAALQLSEGPSAKKKGDIGWVSKAGLVSEFANAAFQAPLKTVIGPVKTVFGFHLIEVLDKKTSNNVEPLAKIRPQIIESLKKRYKMQTEKLPQLSFEEIQKKYSLSLNQKNIEKFFEIIREWQNSLPIVIDSLFNKSYNLELISSPTLSFTAGRMIYSLPDPRIFFKEVKSVSDIESFIKKRLNFEIAVKKAWDEKKIDREEVESRYKNILIYGSIQQLEARWRAEIKVDDKEVMEYYNKNKMNYKVDERLAIWEIATKDGQKAERLYKKLKKNNSIKYFETLARKYSEKKTTASNGGYVGFQTRKQYANISRTAFEAGPEKLVPPRKLGHYFYILRTGEKKDAYIKPLEQVRNEIERKVFTDKFIKFEKEKMMTLKKKYPFTLINKNIRDLS